MSLSFGVNSVLIWEGTMYSTRAILAVLFISLSFADYDYSLEDINSSSEYYEQNVGTSYFPDQVTMHYFGHYN